MVTTGIDSGPFASLLTRMSDAGSAATVTMKSSSTTGWPGQTTHTLGMSYHDIAISTLHSDRDVVHQVLLPLGMGDQAGTWVECTAHQLDERQSGPVEAAICVQHESREPHVQCLCHVRVSGVFLSLPTVSHRFYTT
jgi:hypothetical protein